MVYVTGHRELFDEISGMWEQQKLHHCNKSTYFSSIFESITFEERKETLLEKSRDGELSIIIAKDKELYVGYCLSVAVKGNGSIESLFVLPEYRKQGVARSLVEKSLYWLSEKKCNKITLEVAVGNDEVLLFYEKFGFYPYEIILMRK